MLGLSMRRGKRQVMKFKKTVFSEPQRQGHNEGSEGGRGREREKEREREREKERESEAHTQCTNVSCPSDSFSSVFVRAHVCVKKQVKL